MNSHDSGERKYIATAPFGAFVVRSRRICGVPPTAKRGGHIRGETTTIYLRLSLLSH